MIETGATREEIDDSTEKLNEEKDTIQAIYLEALKIKKGEKLVIICNSPTDNRELRLFTEVAQNQEIDFDVIQFDAEINEDSLRAFETGNFNAAVRIGGPIPEIEKIIACAKQEGVRLLLMPGISAASLHDKKPFIAPFEEMRATAHELINTLKDAAKIIVTDRMGRRLDIELDPSEPWFIEAENMSQPLNPDVPEPPNAPQGEIYKNPKRGRATGILVIQPGGRIDSLVEEDLLAEEVMLRLYNGRIVGVDGGESATKLWKYLLDNNTNGAQEINLEGFRIAELAFGLNPFIAQVTGSKSDTVFDEKNLGTMHIAFGASVMQPDIYKDWVNPRNTADAETHLDFVLNRDDYTIEARMPNGKTVTIFGPAGRFERLRPDNPSSN